MQVASNLVLKTNIPQYHWQEITKKSRKGTFDDNKVYINIAPIPVSKSKTKPPSTFGRLTPLPTQSLYFTVYMGKDVAATLSLTTDDHVELFMDKENPNLIRIKKLATKEILFNTSYKVNRNPLSTTLGIKFTVPDAIRIKPLPSTEIDFELYIDQSMIIDISSFVTHEKRI